MNVYNLQLCPMFYYIVCFRPSSVVGWGSTLCTLHNLYSLWMSSWCLNQFVAENYENIILKSETHRTKIH